MKTAEQTLNDFFKEMHEWEVKTYEIYKKENGGPEQNKEQARNELVKIYEKFLTKKERKTGRLAGPDAGFPPEYDPENERVINRNEKGDVVVIDTKWKHPVSEFFDESHKFYLKKISDEWRIDKKEIFDDERNKWINVVF